MRPTDWLALSRRAAEAARSAVRELPGTAGRSRELGRGEGGDTTLAIDRSAEDAVFAELEALGEPLTAISEERGRVELNGGGIAAVVVLDPIDGSLNAKRGLPPYALSLAVAGGERVDDVHFGFVLDLTNGEEWWAAHGEGAYLDGARLTAPDADDARLELLGVESARPDLVAAAAPALAATGADRLRMIGTIAIAVCDVAGLRLDGLLSLRPARSVDFAAAQLIAREAGCVVTFAEAGPNPSLDLDMRSRIVCAPTQSILDGLLTIGAEVQR